MSGDALGRSAAVAPAPNDTPPRPPLLRLSGVTKSFGNVTAVDDVYMDVGEGEVVGLLGENGAGKTTLMTIAYGLARPDRGHVELRGRRVKLTRPRDALDCGIGMVHQHFMLVDDMTVAENLALTERADRLGPSRIPAVERRVSEISERYGLKVDPRAIVGELSVGAQQRVEILKLLYHRAEILILDEPSAALTPPEWRQLADVIRSLAGEGRGVVLITHKLDELFGVADRCIVLRQGVVAGTVRTADATKRELARMMVGREVALRFTSRRFSPGETTLDVDGLLVRDNDRPVVDVSFSVRQREIFGIAGVDGNGQAELVQALIGVRDPAGGRVLLGGRDIARGGPVAFMAAGGAVIPDDRHRDGLALDLTVVENLVVKEFASQRFSKLGVLNRTAMRRRAQELVEAFDIRAPGIEAQAGQLSGGNQQKLVLARELARRPALLIAAQPTRGLDVGAMEFVYQQLEEFKASGGATLVISTELDEIVSLADRIAVMVGGRFLRVLDRDEADPDVLGLLMAGEAGAHPQVSER